MASAAAGHESIASLLLKAGANAHKGYFREGSALLPAIRNGHETIVRLLIDHGVDINRRIGKGPSPMIVAATSGHESIVKLLLAAGVYRDDNVMELAAQNSHETVVEILRAHFSGSNGINHLVSEESSRHGSNVNLEACSSTQGAAEVPMSLWSAAEGGLESQVLRLLDSGIDVNAWEKYQRGTALSLAPRHGHVSLVEQLLRRGADINLQHEDWTCSPIDGAARYGHLSVVRILLNAQPPANVAVKAGFYDNPLESAAYSGNIAILREIMKVDPDVNGICLRGSFGGTALAAAAAIGHEAMVELLLSKNANVDIVALNSSGRCCTFTPLASAAYGGHIGVARLLLDAGADINLVSGWNERSPLTVAVSQRQRSMTGFLMDANHDQCLDSDVLEAAVSGTEVDVELLRFLLARFAEISNRPATTFNSLSTSQTPLGEMYTTTLLRAVELNRLSAVRELLKHGTNVNAHDNRSYTALHQASETGLEDVAKILVEEYHADIHAKLLNGSLPIHIAAQYGSDGCIQFFLGHGVDVNSTNGELQTPLHTAIDSRKESTVRLLIAAGARLDLADKHDMTPLDLAQYHVAETQKSYSTWQSKYAKTILETIVEELKKQNPEPPALALSQDSEQ